eukprot:4592792-Amphidinium_carterae.1
MHHKFVVIDNVVLSGHTRSGPQEDPGCISREPKTPENWERFQVSHKRNSENKRIHQAASIGRARQAKQTMRTSASSLTASLSRSGLAPRIGI